MLLLSPVGNLGGAPFFPTGQPSPLLQPLPRPSSVHPSLPSKYLLCITLLGSEGVPGPNPIMYVEASPHQQMILKHYRPGIESGEGLSPGRPTSASDTSLKTRL